MAAQSKNTRASVIWLSVAERGNVNFDFIARAFENHRTYLQPAAAAAAADNTANKAGSEQPSSRLNGSNISRTQNNKRQRDAGWTATRYGDVGAGRPARGRVVRGASSDQVSE